MRGVAVADVHLGFRAFSDVTDGRNTREVDVEQAWFRTVQKITEIQPDLVTIAGDIFQHPRVSDHAKKAFIGGLYDIMLDCRCPIIVLKGNHDAGKTADVLTPLQLPAGLIDQLYIVETPKRILLNCGGEEAAVSCFPYVTGVSPQASMHEGTVYKLEPDPKADVNILLMHAAVRGDRIDLPYFYGAGEQSLDIGREIQRWDVIALGDYHEHTMLDEGRLAFYSGSLERTSSNIWQEEAPKGFVEYDTDGDKVTFHEIDTRPMIDIDFVGDTAEHVNLKLQAMIQDYETLTDALVRLKVDDFPREEREHIDWALVRTLKSRCTHFYLDIRYAKRESIDLGDRREGDRLSLDDEIVVFFQDDDTEVRKCAYGFLGIEGAS